MSNRLAIFEAFDRIRLGGVSEVDIDILVCAAQDDSTASFVSEPVMSVHRTCLHSPSKVRDLIPELRERQSLRQHESRGIQEVLARLGVPESKVTQEAKGSLTYIGPFSKQWESALHMAFSHGYPSELVEAGDDVCGVLADMDRKSSIDELDNTG
jgi:hypothetical protein